MAKYQATLVSNGHAVHSVNYGRRIRAAEGIGRMSGEAEWELRETDNPDHALVVSDGKLLGHVWELDTHWSEDL